MAVTDGLYTDSSSLSRLASVALWAGFCVMWFGALIFSGISFSVSSRQRKFHSIALFSVVVGALSYFSTLLDEDGLFIRASDTHLVAWARYYDMAVTFPICILLLGFLVDRDVSDLLGLGGLSALHVWANYQSAMSSSENDRIIWMVVGLLSALPIVLVVVGPLRNQVEDDEEKEGPGNSTNTKGVYNQCVLVFVSVLILNQIIWVTGPATSLLTTNEEQVAFVVMDVVLKIVFGWLVVRKKDVIERMTEPMPVATELLTRT